MRDLFGYRWAFRCTTDPSPTPCSATAGPRELHRRRDRPPRPRRVLAAVRKRRAPPDQDRLPLRRPDRPTWPPMPPSSAARTRPHDRHHRPPGRPAPVIAPGCRHKHCQESVDTKRAAAGRRERRLRRVRPPRPARLRAPHRQRRHRIPHAHDPPRRRHRHRHRRRRHRAARLRLLLGRDRFPARVTRQAAQQRWGGQP